MLALQVDWLSERGGRKVNEDACGHWRSDRALCAVLADGAGGHGGGDIASRLAVRELLTHFAQAPPPDADALRTLVFEINHMLLDAREPGTPRQDMHSTVVCLVLDFVDGKARWAHAGDSRLYWFRAGRLRRRTLDHSLVQSLVDAGLLTPEEVRGHAQRSELRSALGVGDDQLEVDATEADADVEPGDAFLLCTDGVWEHLDDALIVQALAEAGSPRDWLDGLSAGVRAAAQRQAHHDNFSALAVWVAADA
ncbi:MAG: protein phosphatase 2C domain-containing protein [Rubrivivax sp.]